MSNVWNSLSFSDEADATSFNDTVVGGNYLGVGSHPNLIAQDVERAVSKSSGNPQLIITWANEDGATIKQFVPMQGRDKDGNTVLHFVCRMVLSALIPDRELRAEFLQKAFANTELFEGLKGARANLKVKPGSRGYEIREGKLGDYYIFDAEEQANAIEDSFDSFSEARTHAEDELGMKRAYPEIDKTLPASEAELVEANLSGVRELIASASAPAKKPARAASRL